MTKFFDKNPLPPSKFVFVPSSAGTVAICNFLVSTAGAYLVIFILCSGAIEVLNPWLLLECASYMFISCYITAVLCAY